MLLSAASTASMRSSSARHSGQSVKCFAIASRRKTSPPWYAINSSSFGCFIVLFPLLSLALGAPRKALTSASTFARTETRCSSPRWNSTSAPRQFLRFLNRPSGASQKPCVRPESTHSARAAYGRLTARFAPGVPATARHPAPNSLGLARFRLQTVCLRVAAARLRFCVDASGQSRSWPRCGTPTFQNWRAPQTGRVSDTPARKPPALPPPRRVGCRSCDRQGGTRCGCAARPKCGKRRDRPRAFARRRWRHCPQWSRRSASSASLDRFSGLRLGLFYQEQEGSIYVAQHSWLWLPD